MPTRITLSAATTFLVVAAPNMSYWHIPALSDAERARYRVQDLTAETMCGLRPTDGAPRAPGMEWGGEWLYVRTVTIGRNAHVICPHCLPLDPASGLDLREEEETP